MKKAVILLITLMFVLLISSLILNSMKNSEKIIDENSIDATYSQSLITFQNFKEQITSKLDSISQEHLYDVLPIVFPLEISSNISAVVEVEKFQEMYDINSIKIEKEENNFQDVYISLIFQDKNINYEVFKYFLDRYKSTNELYTISSKKQIEKVLEEYRDEYKQNEAFGLIEHLTFFDASSSEELKYVLCKIRMNINNKTFYGEFIYNLEQKEVSGIDFRF